VIIYIAKLHKRIEVEYIFPSSLNFVLYFKSRFKYSTPGQLYGDFGFYMNFMVILDFKSMGFFNGFLLLPEIRSVVNKASKYFHVLIYDIEHTNYNLLVVF